MFSLAVKLSEVLRFTNEASIVVPSDIIRHPGNKKLWLLLMCFLIPKNINIVQKHVTSFPP